MPFMDHHPRAATLTLTDFLLARIDDDQFGAFPHLARCVYLSHPSHDLCDCGYPARMNAEIQAKRQIVEMHAVQPHPLNRRANPFTGKPEEDTYICEECSGIDDAYIDQVEYPCDTIKVIACIYADHPDYRDEWRP